MNWNESYSDNSIQFVYDKYGRVVKKNDRVLWASKNVHNSPYIVEGTVLGFNKSPSFTNVFIKSDMNRVVKKLHNQIVKII